MSTPKRETVYFDGHRLREGADLATKGLPDDPGVATRFSGRGAHHFVDVGARLRVA